MTETFGASAPSSLPPARRQPQGQARLSSPTLAGPAWGEVRINGSPGQLHRASLPPPRWAMSNQPRGQGALWTERDKRPCVHCGLLIYRPLHPLPPGGRPGPLRREGQSPQPRRRSPPGGWERSPGPKGFRLTSSLRDSAPCTGSCSPASSSPGSSLPPHSQLQPAAKPAPGGVRRQPKRSSAGSKECTRDGSVAAGGPPPAPPLGPAPPARARPPPCHAPSGPPLLAQLEPERGVAGGGGSQEPRPPGDPPPTQSAHSRDPAPAYTHPYAHPLYTSHSGSTSFAPPRLQARLLSSSPLPSSTACFSPLRECLAPLSSAQYRAVDRRTPSFCSLICSLRNLRSDTYNTNLTVSATPLNFPIASHSSLYIDYCHDPRLLARCYSWAVSGTIPLPGMPFGLVNFILFSAHFLQEALRTCKLLLDEFSTVRMEKETE